MAADRTWHFITCEYPPQIGGVADFAHTVARELAHAGQPVHVWSPPPAAGGDGVTVHEVTGGYRASGLAALDAALDALPPPRRVFVHWVPHGYGCKSLNVPFCLWVRRRARRGDEVELMVHEPFLAFEGRRLRQNVGAVVHRAMLRLLLGVAQRVWVSTPSFIPDVRRFSPRGAPEGRWLPVPSPVAPVDDPNGVRTLRAEFAREGPLVGYFGTCSPVIAARLAAVIEQLVLRRPDLRVALIGRGTAAFLQDLMARRRVPPGAVLASGERPYAEISLLLQACDVFVQPYHDGVSVRRTTLMGLLEHGCAVVTSAGLRTEPFWFETDWARVTPPADPKAMAEAAVRLLDNDEERSELGARARAAYGRHFCVRRTLAALMVGSNA